MKNNERVPRNIPRYSTLVSGKMHELAAAVMQQGCDAHEFTILVWDADGEGEYPITGFVIDAEKKTISLRSDID